MGDVEELPPSKLGTKEHWDEVYRREVGVFEETGDEGEIWFGESSVTKMVRWSIKNFSPNLPQFAGGGPTILECGCGNGTLLLEYLKPWVRAELREEGGRVYQPGDLTGVDYSEGSVELAKKVEEQRRANGWRGADDDDDEEDDEEISAAEVDDRPVSWRTVDLLRSTLSEQWDLVLDKGTFDALALSSEPVEGDGRLPSVIYPERIAKLVKPGGYFLITSCNFTEEEVKRRFEQGGLRYHSTVPQPSFSFGGKSGTSVCTVAFSKTA